MSRTGEPGTLRRGGLGELGELGVTCLARWTRGARAHVHQQQRGQRELWTQRQAASSGEGARRSDHRVLGTMEGTGLPPNSEPGAPRPPSHPGTSAARMRRNCSAEGKAGLPARRHSRSGLQSRLSR